MQWFNIEEITPICDVESTDSYISKTVIVTDGFASDHAHLDESGEWIVYNSYGYLDPLTITHWCDVPKLP